MTSVDDISVGTVHQYLDCNQCLLITEKASKKGKLALVPSGAFDKDMGKGLVLEHRDQAALRVWEERLRKHLRGNMDVILYTITPMIPHVLLHPYVTPSNPMCVYIH